MQCQGKGHVSSHSYEREREKREKIERELRKTKNRLSKIGNVIVCFLFTKSCIYTVN